MTSGVSAVDILVGVAAGLTALGVIWRKFLRPLARAAQKVNETLPVIVSIAEEFRPNHGKSLHDIITKIADDGAVLSEYAHNTKHDTVNRLTVLAGNQDLLSEKVEAFIAEARGRFEALGAEVTTVKSDVAVVMTIVERRNEPR